MRRPIAVLLAAAAPLLASEADGKALRQAHTELVKAGDLWSALCLEAIARERKQRIEGALGASEFWGDPAFATPDHILRILDRGDDVLVVTARRFHRFLPDGRPAAPSTPLPFTSWCTDFSADGRWLGAGEARRNRHRVNGLRVAVRPLSGPGEPWQQERDSGEVEPNALVVAEDGSAAALVATWGDQSRRRVWIATPNREVDRTVPLRTAEAVGPHGRWLVGRDYEEQLQLVRSNDERVRLRDFAAGPGLAAAIDLHGHAVLIAANGETPPLEPGMGLSGNADLAAVGRWLVLFSGWGAKAPPTTDVLGNRWEGGDAQPPRMACWRWSDLVADPRAAPAQYLEGQLSVARGEPAALFHWQGDALSLLDCSGAELVERPVGKAPAAIRWAGEMPGATICDLADGTSWFCDREGRELGRVEAPAERISQLDNRLVQIYQGKEKSGQPTMQVLALDPSRRREYKPAAPGASYLPSQGGGLLAVAGEGGWSLLDAGTGAALGQAKGDIPELFEMRWGDAGRFVNRRYRLAPRGQDSAPPGDAWMPVDGWRSGRNLVVLCRDGRLVHVTSKREFKDLGFVPGAQHLAQAQGGLAVVAPDGTVLALLRSGASGPALVREGIEGLRAEPLPPGPWRVEEERFVPPRGNPMAWDERTGIVPLRLRSPEGSGMLAFCGAAVIELDPAAAKLIGRVP